MRRRRFLLAGGALLAGPLAGCVHPPNVLTMDAVSDAELAERTAQHVPNDADQRAAIHQAAENGSATFWSSAPRLDEETPVGVNGSYYRVSHTEIDSRERTAYDVKIQYDPGDWTPEYGAIAYDELPAVDRAAFGTLVTRADEHDRESDGFDVGAGDAYADLNVSESVFVPEQQYDAVTYEGETVRVAIDADARRVEHWRLELSPVADSAAEYARQVRDEYLFALSGLSSAEREIVEQAIDGGYYESTTDAFESLVDRLESHRAFEKDDFWGEWLVRYDGTDYWTYAEY